MPTFRFSKLVRDKIVEQQIAEGSTLRYRVLTVDNHKKELIKKVAEEVREVSKAVRGDVASELADVQQALDDLRKLYNVSKAEISAEQRRKRQQKGAFKKGLYVDTITTDENNEWTKYYRTQPSRYPEIK